MVISASWLSRTGDGDGTLNLRGISTVLALAGFLKRGCILVFTGLYHYICAHRSLILGQGHCAGCQ